jgi:hypothetical protein
MIFAQARGKRGNDRRRLTLRLLDGAAIDHLPHEHQPGRERVRMIPAQHLRAEQFYLLQLVLRLSVAPEPPQCHGQIV